MKRTVKSISVYDLKPNMFLDKDLIINGITLVGNGVPLTALMIKKISQFYTYDGISIYIDEKERSVPSSETSVVKSLTRTEDLLNYFVDKIDIFLSNIDKNSKLDLNDIRTMSKSLLDDSSDYSSILQSITKSRTIDEYLVRHCVNVAFLSSMLGRWLDLSKNDLILLTYAAFLHDIGKTMVNPKILNKPTQLTKLEFEEIKKHSIYSYNLVRTIPYLDKSVGLGVLMHHERLDGSGYPLHLKEDKINTFAKIIGITDTFDAMTSDKVYRKKQVPLKVLEIMQRECITVLDYDYLSIFIKQMLNYYIGQSVKLNNGSIGQIVKIDINNIYSPLISIGQSFVDLNTQNDLFIIDF